jgi:hypothetical protein
MRRLVPVFLLALMPLACNRPAAPTAVSGPASAPGWEVRYNAAAALARRGSDKALDESVRTALLEMLDEEQQLRNFPVKDEKGIVRKDKDGRTQPDVAAAQLTVVSTLRALTELHRRRPELDLSPFKPAVAKLTQSASLGVSTEAKKAEQIFTAKS